MAPTHPQANYVGGRIGPIATVYGGCMHGLVYRGEVSSNNLPVNASK